MRSNIERPVVVRIELQLHDGTPTQVTVIHYPSPADAIESFARATATAAPTPRKRRHGKHESAPKLPETSNDEK